MHVSACRECRELESWIISSVSELNRISNQMASLAGRTPVNRQDFAKLQHESIKMKTRLEVSREALALHRRSFGL